MWSAPPAKQRQESGNPSPAREEGVCVDGGGTRGGVAGGRWLAGSVRRVAVSKLQASSKRRAGGRGCGQASYLTTLTTLVRGGADRDRRGTCRRCASREEASGGFAAPVSRRAPPRCTLGSVPPTFTIARHLLVQSSGVSTRSVGWRGGGGADSRLSANQLSNVSTSRRSIARALPVSSCSPPLEGPCATTSAISQSQTNARLALQRKGSNNY